MSFIGKFAAVGQGGSGKTRGIAEIANYLAKQILYPWNEDSNMAGTLTVTPYSMSIPITKKMTNGYFNQQENVRRIILADNPGQNSLELVRISVAKSGANYKGLLIFADAIGWNFRTVGLSHAKSIINFLDSTDIPIALITSKADIIIAFQQTSFLNEIIVCISDTVKSAINGQKIPFYDRVLNSQKQFQLKILEGGWIQFTQLEQLMVNSLDAKFNQSEHGFTVMNRRLFVRSLLLGYCDYYRKEYPEYIKSYPVFNAIDDNLLNSLNYHRPTSYETGTPWKVLASQRRSGAGVTKNEPPFRLEAFDDDGMNYVLRNFCLGTQSRHYELEALLRDKSNNFSWNLVASAYTDSVTRPGIEKMLMCIQKLVEEAELQVEQKMKVTDLDKLGLGEF